MVKHKLLQKRAYFLHGKNVVTEMGIYLFIKRCKTLAIFSIIRFLSTPNSGVKSGVLRYDKQQKRCIPFNKYAPFILFNYSKKRDLFQL